ncbi:MAG: membrane protein insertase YidC [Acidobacteriota bacterium]|nr:membrane protein insertase YidC [Acidobacteriota bacterium]
MDKKTIVAFLLIGLIIILWPVYMEKVAGVKQGPARQEAVSPGPAESANSAAAEGGAPAPEVTPGRIETQRVTPVLSASVPAETLLVQTDLYEARLSTAGGGTPVSWKLKRFRDSRDNWVELIPDSAAGNLGLMFDAASDPALMVFRVASDRTETEQGLSRRKILLSADFPNLGRVEKEFTFTDGSYEVGLEVRFEFSDRSAVRDHYLIRWESGLLPTERNIRDETSYAEASALQGTELLKTKSDNTGLREGVTRWVAVQTKYFIMAVIPRGVDGRGAELKTRKVTLDREGGKANWKRFGVGLSVPFDSGVRTSHRFTLLVGPMDHGLLKAQDVQLERLLSFGWSWLRPICIAFLHVLQFLYGIVGNYGWAIVIFSVLIKIALYPLTKKSYDSMKEMQELQPKLKALQERYKNEPQKLNAETMKMYKAHGVNPMSGCLPLLLQMPILFALFNVFRATIMFRQAGFLGIIKDLSGPDRMIPLGGSAAINVLPLLMGVTMFIQQKKTVTDPKQKFMSYFMSIFMVYIFYGMSAGLNLYYLMFNVLTIAQDWIIRKKPQPARDAA